MLIARWVTCFTKLFFQHNMLFRHEVWKYWGPEEYKQVLGANDCVLGDNSAAPSEGGLSPAAAVFLGTVRQLSPTDSNFTQFPSRLWFLFAWPHCLQMYLLSQHGECCTPIPLSPCWSTAAGEVTSATGWKELWAMLRWHWSNASLGGCRSKGLVTWLQWICLKTGRAVCKALVHRAGFTLGCACSGGQWAAPVGLMHNGKNWCFS